MDENEMKQTLTEVARMKVQFDLLKQVIMNSFELNYSGDALRIANDGLIIEVMELIEPDDMIGIFDHLKSKAQRDAEETAKMVAMTKEDDNG